MAPISTSSNCLPTSGRRRLSRRRPPLAVPGRGRRRACLGTHGRRGETCVFDGGKLIYHRRTIVRRHFAFSRQLAEPLEIEDRHGIFSKRAILSLRRDRNTRFPRTTVSPKYCPICC